MADLLAHLDSRIAEKHLLNHPFYQSWTRGELSRATLQDYARQYYQHVAAFPTYLSAVHSNTDDQAARREILANLMDEEGSDPSHPELWLRFAESMGVDRADTQTTTPWPETQMLIDTFRDICKHGSTEQGLAALYAYETQVPAVSESKIDGLRRFYGIDNERDIAYFHVHVDADKEHAAAERALLERKLNNGNARAASDSANRILDALWGMLDGVCHRHGIACN